MTGTIKKLVKERGFGFVRPSEKGVGDIFFHLSSLLGAEWEDLQEGMRVEFETEEGRNGLQVRSKPRSLKVLG